MDRKCLNCEEQVEGRVDKLFCSPYCKSAYHYQQKKYEGQTFFKLIDQQLKRNRRLLMHFNAAGKSIIRKEDLLKQGFNPKIFTHYWKTHEGDVYLFCYDFGFKEITDNKKNKYLLIQWQDYMAKQTGIY